MKKEKVKKVINLTPHPVRILGAGEDGGDLVIPSSGSLRVSETTKKVGEIELVVERGPPDYDDCPRELAEIEFKSYRIPVYKVEYGTVDIEPPSQEGTIYIVSSIVAQACPHRPDFYTPADYVRDSEGRIIGCRGLLRNPWFKGASDNNKKENSDSNNEGRPCNCGSGLPWYRCTRASSYCG